MENSLSRFPGGRILLRLLAVTAAVGLLLFATSVPAHAASEALPERLVVAIPNHFPPQYIVRGDGSWTGFAIDVIEAVAERAGIRLVYLPKDNWSNTIDALRNGEADLIPNIGITPERERDFAFTRPIETFKISVFVRNDTLDIVQLEDLASRKVAAVKSNAAQYLLAERPEQGLELVVYDRLSEAMLALLSGWVDALAYPEPNVWQTAIEAGLEARLKVIGQPLQEIKRAMAVRKDRQALRDHLDRELAEFQRSSQFHDIYRKWYSRVDPWWQNPGGLLGLASLLLLAVLLRYLMMWRNHRQLKRELEINTKIARAVQESEERYRNVVESLVEGVIIQTRDNKIATANLSASKILGVTPEYLQGSLLTDSRWKFVRADGSDLPPEEHPVRKTLDSGTPEHAITLGLGLAQQEQRWISFNTQPFYKQGEKRPYAVVASFQDITALKESLETLNRKNQLLDTLSRVQSRFIVQENESEAFDLMLEGLLTLTGSEYGFIGKTLTDPAGAPYLRTYAITNIAWNDETQALFDAKTSQGMEFRNLDSLFGRTIATGEAVVSNHPAGDTRSGGLPPGHPALNSFLGLPIKLGDKLVGMAGIANRENGYDLVLVEELEPFLKTAANLIEALEERHKRSLAQLALRDSESRLRSVLDNAVDSIIIIDARGTIQSFNRASESIFGYHASEVVGKNVSMLMPSTLADEHDRYLAASQAVTGGPLAVPREVIGLHRDGSNLSIEISVGRVEVQGQDLFTGILREVSQRKRMEAELQRHRDHLESLVQERTAELNAANEEIKQFAYIVSHDLRAPLVNIKGFSRELDNGLKELYALIDPLLLQLKGRQKQDWSRITQEDLPEAMEFIQSSASKMDRQIDAILKLSRTGQREFVSDELDMDKLVQRILDTMAHRIEAADVKISVPSLPCIVADPSALEQIFSNLLDNAVKYLRPGIPGLIEIQAKQDQHETRFSICDNGRGISERDIGKIFSIFQRAGVPDQIGDGMGLTYVQSLLKRLGGRVWCDSRPNEGSCFHFTIPQQDVSTDLSA